MNTRLAVLAPLFLALAACSDSPGDSSTTPGPALPAPSRAGWESDGAFPGFTLVRPLESRVTYLVDMSGTAVHSWTSPGMPSGGRYLTERGTLLHGQAHEDHPIFRGGGMSGGIEELDWDGSVLWTFDWDSESGINHHDIEELPNGNVLFIAWDRHTRKEALAAGRDPDLLEGQEFWPDAIYEVRPTRPVGGEIVWSWHAWDHLVQDVDPDGPNYGRPREHPERIDINGDRNPDPPSEEQEAAELAQMQALGYVGGPAEDDDDDEEEDPEEAAFRARIDDADWMHSNGLDYNAELDQIVLSVRRFDEVWILDHSTTTEEAAGSTGGRSGKGGDLLYRWGNPFAYGRGTWDDRQLLGQHNVQWIPDGHLGAGGLLVFDNGTDKDRPWSMVKEWWPPRDAAGHYLREEGQPFGPAAPDWSWQAAEPETFFSSFISGAQRLPNGNTLACAGKHGYVVEVTPDGDVVWDWLNPYGLDPEVDEAPDPDDDEVPQSALFRAERYAPDHPAIVALRAKGAPIPDDPGTGPATNQGEWPAEDDEDAEEPSPDR